MNISDFQYNDWINQWAGNWSALSTSYFGIIYTQKPFASNVERYVDQTIILWADGKSQAYQRVSLKKIFGEELLRQINRDKNLVECLITQIKAKADEFLLFVDNNIGQDISLEIYLKFQKLIAEYYPLHIQLKTMADYFDQNLFDVYFDKLENIRLYIEPVLSKSEEFIIELAKIHEKKTNYPYYLILTTIMEEFHNYLEKGKLPKQDVLIARNTASAILFKNGQKKIFYKPDDISAIRNLVKKNNEFKEEVRGAVAYPGKVKGVVKIVLDPKKVSNFIEGTVLVSGMTRPEYLELMKKASAIVTDAGGMLCHAAIVSRELKTPCIVGTEIATKVLKDGDMVEVDANSGIVRKLK